MKLNREQHLAIINEMRLAELFTEKMWAARYGISVRTVKRLRAAARKRNMAQNGPRIFNARVECV